MGQFLVSTQYLRPNNTMSRIFSPPLHTYNHIYWSVDGLSGSTLHNPGTKFRSVTGEVPGQSEKEDSGTGRLYHGRGSQYSRIPSSFLTLIVPYPRNTPHPLSRRDTSTRETPQDKKASWKGRRHDSSHEGILRFKKQCHECRVTITLPTSKSTR